MTDYFLYTLLDLDPIIKQHTTHLLSKSQIYQV